MASMPIKLMEQCLPWIASYLTDEEQLDMVRQIHRVVPNEELLQQVRRMPCEAELQQGVGQVECAAHRWMALCHENVVAH